MWREGLSRTPRPGSATFVAVVEEEIVGFATVGASYSEEGPGELYAIYVDPSSWGTGAGRALIERAEASLRESGFPSALLWVLAGNERAERFYRSAGWEHDGEKEDDFQGARVTELRYRKTL
jgi:GNAT superfamily N-acetyltransferase